MKKDDGKKKKTYQKPKIRSEKMTVIAAVCNGTSTGGRKAIAGPCASNKLKS